MKAQMFGTIVSESEIKTRIKKMSLDQKGAYRTNKKKICPFTFEPLADCGLREVNGYGKVCPFSLETCHT